MKALTIETYAAVGQDENGKWVCERGMTKRQAQLKARKMTFFDGRIGEVYRDIDMIADGRMVHSIYARTFWEYDGRKWKERLI